MENGRVALVSGGNRGIGLEIVHQLAERGNTVILGSRDEEQGRAAAEGLSGDVVVRQLDVTDEKSVDWLAASVEEEFGRLDILVTMLGSRTTGASAAWTPTSTECGRRSKLICSERGDSVRHASRSCSATATEGSSTSPAAWAL